MFDKRPIVRGILKKTKSRIVSALYNQFGLHNVLSVILEYSLSPIAEYKTGVKHEGHPQIHHFHKICNTDQKRLTILVNPQNGNTFGNDFNWIIVRRREFVFNAKAKAKTRIECSRFRKIQLVDTRYLNYTIDCPIRSRVREKIKIMSQEHGLLFDNNLCLTGIAYRSRHEL